MYTFQHLAGSSGRTTIQNFTFEKRREWQAHYGAGMTAGPMPKSRHTPSAVAQEGRSEGSYAIRSCIREAGSGGGGRERDIERAVSYHG
jgi:hypothetical protein